MAEADPSPPVAETAPPASDKVDWLAELRGLALMLLAVVGFHSLIAKPFYIPSISMMPSLLVGDRLVVSKYPYGWSWVSASFHVLPREKWRVLGRTPEYGDIVIVVPPDRDVDYIKRVIGLPGDRVAVVNGQIVLNGKPVPQAVEPPLDLAIDANQPCEREVFPNLATRLPSGAPTLALTGGAAARLASLIPAGHEAVVHLTLTDDHPWAQAFVIIEARPVG